MPEIAECRRYVDQLNAKFGGQKVNTVNIVGGRFRREGVPGLPLVNFPWSNVSFHSKGKFIYCKFIAPNTRGDDDPVDQHDTLFITLGMAASFGERNKHSALEFVFESGSIFYHSPKRIPLPLGRG